MPRHKRTIPLLSGVDWTVPWAILPATLTELTNVLRQGVIPKPADPDAPFPVARISLDDSEGGAARTAGAVAVLSLRGIIMPRTTWLSMIFGGGWGLDMFREAFREALADDDITAILLEIDSPGGQTSLVAETADEIRAARGQGKPIVAIANTLAASAAYWIASAADQVVVTPSGFAGGVGTYITHLETSKFDAELGFTYTLISAGEHKTDGNEHEPLSDSARANYQQIVDSAEDLFVAGVAAGRGVDEATVRSGFGQGHVLPPDASLAAGMIDRVETIEQTVARLLAGRGPGARSPLAATVAAPVAPADAPAELTPAASADGADAPDDAEPSSPPPAEREAAATGLVPAWQLIPTRRH